MTPFAWNPPASMIMFALIVASASATAQDCSNRAYFQRFTQRDTKQLVIDKAFMESARRVHDVEIRPVVNRMQVEQVTPPDVPSNSYALEIKDNNVIQILTRIEAKQAKIQNELNVLGSRVINIENNKVAIAGKSGSNRRWPGDLYGNDGKELGDWTIDPQVGIPVIAKDVWASSYIGSAKIWRRVRSNGRPIPTTVWYDAPARGGGGGGSSAPAPRQQGLNMNFNE